VALPGRSFDQIQTEQDVNRPFSVIGTFDDAELLSIVRFYRKKYPSIALRGIERDSLGHILVSIATEPIRYVLGKQDQGWVILLKEPIVERQLSNDRKPVSPMDKFAPPAAILNHVENVPR